MNFKSRITGSQPQIAGSQPRTGQTARDPAQEAIVEQQDSQRQHEMIQEGEVCGEDDSDLKRSDDEEAGDAPAARQEKHPDQSEFGGQREQRHSSLKLVRKLLGVPADPVRQRTVFVVVIEGG